MGINSILQYIGTIITVLTAGFMLYKARKILPTELATSDAGAAKTYAEVAKIAGEQIASALKRIEDLEQCGQNLQERISELKSALQKSDEAAKAFAIELHRRDDLIADWNRGIRILTNQLEAKKITPLWIPRSWGIPKND